MSGQFFEDDLRERFYSTRELALRDLFVKEYLIDHNAVSAAMRCGFNGQTAPQYAHQFMDEPYVQKKLAEAQSKILDIDSEEGDVERQRIIAGLIREANYRGPGSSHSARVAALSKLSAIFKLESTSAANLGEQSGVMEVPGVASVENWQEVASSQQEKLKNDSVVH